MFLSSGSLWIDLVEHSIQTGHEQRGEGDGKGLAAGSVRTILDALGLRAVAIHRDADCRGAVASGVGQVNRGFIAGHQAFVTVRGRVTNGAECFGGALSKPPMK